MCVEGDVGEVGGEGDADGEESCDNVKGEGNDNWRGIHSEKSSGLCEGEEYGE